MTENIGDIAGIVTLAGFYIYITARTYEYGREDERRNILRKVKGTQSIPEDYKGRLIQICEER